MMELQFTGAWNVVVFSPFFSSPIAAGSDEAVHDRKEDGSLNRKLKVTPQQQGVEHLVYRAGLPEPLKDQRRADPGRTSGDAMAAGMGTENGELLREPPQRQQERIELTVGEQFIEAAKPMQDSLFDLAVDPLVVDDQQVCAGAVSLSADEHGVFAPVTP